MNAIKAGIITKTTKKELEKIEREQENIEMLIVQEQIDRPTLSKEQIEAWIMSFAKTNLNSVEQKMKLIDVFVNSIFVYDDKMLVIFNYKNGEKCVSLDELDFMAQKKNTHNECSSLNKFGDPYGN